MSASIPREINTALSAIKALREIGKEMPTQMAHVFLVIANHPGLSTHEIIQLTEMEKSSVQRAAQTLGKYRRDGSPGYDVIEGAADPRDTRALIWSLTPKGVAAAANLVATMRGKRAEIADLEVPSATQVADAIRRGRLAKS